MDLRRCYVWLNVHQPDLWNASQFFTSVKSMSKEVLQSLCQNRKWNKDYTTIDNQQYLGCFPRGAIYFEQLVYISTLILLRVGKSLWGGEEIPKAIHVKGNTYSRKSILLRRNYDKSFYYRTTD